MKTICAATVLSLFAVCTGCSSSQEPQSPSPTTSGSSGTTGSSGSSGSSGDTTSGGTSGTPAATLKAPKVDQVAKMMGALHVMWTNQEATCDAIVGERKAQMADGTVHEPYAVAFTVPGEADNKHDTKATADMKYTYRLRCKKGETFSEYSNEVSGNPK